ncbi:polyadenylate-binding protein [Coprinopsis cinerea AmutBmut pab1-1]|nr:polyadenylate-binding protein [Coprinopsis cinerea AmutBmut pab1-1]
MAPSGGISIPAHDNVSNGAPADDQNWNGNDRRSPPRDSRDRERDRDRERNGDPPRRSSRSRSPARGGEDRERASRSENGGQNPGNNLHVSGLSHRVDSRDLETAFAKIGRVQKASVMYDPHTRESRGFGFVTMETTEEAEAAISSLNGTELMGKIITIEKVGSLDSYALLVINMAFRLVVVALVPRHLVDTTAPLSVTIVSNLGL